MCARRMLSEPIHLSYDIDPTIAPGTGAPELDSYQALEVEV